MKVAILAGGVGSRLTEETVDKPKALVKIGDYPILWHIMMHYSHFGFNEFVIALGYKGECIVRWVQEYCESTGTKTVKDGSAAVVFHAKEHDWTICLVETGQKTNTGGRVKQLAPWLGNQTFMLTWCDGLSDVDIGALLRFHRSHGRLATLTAVLPPPRFGFLVLDEDVVVRFSEKVRITKNWINGAFFVLEPDVINYIDGDETSWERDSLVQLSKEGQLMAYRHGGFWQCMDTIHERHILEKLWRSGKAPWKTEN